MYVYWPASNRIVSTIEGKARKQILYQINTYRTFFLGMFDGSLEWVVEHSGSAGVERRQDSVYLDYLYGVVERQFRELLLLRRDFNSSSHQEGNSRQKPTMRELSLQQLPRSRRH